MKSKETILKICEFCGNTFNAHKTTTHYCSHACSSRAYKENKRQMKLTAVNYRVMQEIEMISDRYEKIKDKEFLSVSETAFLLSVGRTKNIAYHCFRHTYVTLQIALGTDIYTISKMLTHKDVPLRCMRSW